MVELLVVLVIIGILAAVATPLFIQNTQRARAAEAVAGMGLIRQAQRDYNINALTYFNIIPSTTAFVSNINNPLPTTVVASVPTPATAGVAISVGISQYFSNRAYSVSVTAAGTAGASGLFTVPFAQNFIITATGASSDLCSTVNSTNCAIRANQVNAGAGSTILEMDNTGRIFISYGNGAANTWSPY